MLVKSHLNKVTVGSQGEVYSLQVTVGSQGEVYSLQVTGFSRRGIFSSGNWVLKET
jgi:hypothetical protein